ncbi:MAG TPA: 6,7-dimethyl-8-ribityllumazine synthase [Solirubrobacterales bacterium]|nr:6,7-dimethyl-8-ribityllumazine synthase [Solirubrobacterales bacterium]
MAEAGAFLEQFSDEEKAKLEQLEFAVLVGRFYEDLALRLLDGADHGFQMAGVPIGNVTHHSVPGAYELPFAAKLHAESGEFAGVACLGVVIRGETDHYDFVCAEAARGIQDVQLATGVPCAFGVITCDNMEQALARAGGDKRDQGRNAALTVMRMALLDREINGGLGEAAETNGDGQA